MELSTSLRSLEAAGRPSGTGRPSIPSAAPRNDAQAGRAPEKEPHDDPSPRSASSDEPSASKAPSSRAHRAARRSAEASASDESSREASTFEEALERAPSSSSTEAAGSATPNKATKLATPAATGASTNTPPPADVATELATPAAPRREGDAANASDVQSKDAAHEKSDAPILAVPLLGADVPANAELAPRTVELANTSSSDAITLDAPVADASTAIASDAEASSNALATLPLTHATSDASTNTPLPPHAASAPITANDAARASELPAPPTNTREAAPPRDDRAADILRQVRVQLVPHARQALIQLAPAELGRIAIHVTLHQDGVIAEVRAEKREALDALQRHLPELRSALSRQGFEAQRVDLALGFEERRSGRSGGEERARRSFGSRADEEQPAIAAASAPLARWIRADGIDTYA